MISVLIASAAIFQSVISYTPVSPRRYNRLTSSSFQIPCVPPGRRSSTASLFGSKDDGKDILAGESISKSKEISGNFEGQGLANYLAIYALAFLASIGVTAAFVKFVLLDY